MDRAYSCTSNTVKLFKHLDNLQSMQNGMVVPIMIHMMPTHRCQMLCEYCCFKNRKDKHLDMPFDHLRIGVEQFRKLGTKAIEITGGGDPTLYPWINDTMNLLHNLGYKIGVNTNAVDSQLIEHWGWCDWVRVSMNTLDVHDELNLKPIKDSGTYISACYIWHKNSTFETFKRVADFCKREKIVCRVAPDCITSLDEIDDSVDFLREVMIQFINYKYLFLSDFNIDTKRHNTNCYIHMIKPAFYTDGYVYPCPSSELAKENDSQMQPSFAVCRYDEIFDFYTSMKAIRPTEKKCSYCKYEKQQVVLEEVLTETEFNEFA
jgi:MoaA/NifB/PqqE/SkfB family radical SAM enzyme